jgi:glycosyltransferase involved in cell wall biosynthesis
MLQVSVIIPCYNYGRFVGDAVESVLAQTLSPHEVIVVDDGSTDETARVLARFGERIRVVYQKNQGVATARNAGVAHATGDLFAFLDADDVWLPAKLEKQVRRFAGEPDLGLVHCGVLEVDAAGKPLRLLLDGMEGWVAEELLLFRRNVILGGGSAMVVSRAAFNATGGFDDRLPPTEDWDLWYRLARRHRVGFVPEVLVQYRCHGSNHSQNLKKRERGVLLIYEKAFQDPDPQLQRLRRRAYGNLHLGLAGFYFSAGQSLNTLRHLLRSLWLTPSNCLRLLGYPFRYLRRRVRERPVTPAGAKGPLQSPTGHGLAQRS